VDVDWDKVNLEDVKGKFSVTFIKESNVAILKLYPGLPDLILENFLKDPIKVSIFYLLKKRFDQFNNKFY
jgi:hypothetical protein